MLVIAGRGDLRTTHHSVNNRKDSCPNRPSSRTLPPLTRKDYVSFLTKQLGSLGHALPKPPHLRSRYLAILSNLLHCQNRDRDLALHVLDESVMSDSRNQEFYKEHLRKEGWVRIPSVITKERADAVLERLWEAKEQGENRGDQTYLPHLDPNSSNVRVFYLLELDPVFRELIAHETIIELVKYVLGENFLISNFTANIARPGAQSMALHSDQSIIVPNPWIDVWVLNAIWCLTDVYKENGATLYIPGSNKWEMQSDVPRNANEMLRPFEAKAGDVILMDGRVWHTSGTNITKDQDRALMFGAYSAPFLRQQVNWTAKLPKELQDSLSDEMKNWLGLSAIANTGKTGGINYNYLSKQYGEAKAAL